MSKPSSVVTFSVAALEQMMTGRENGKADVIVGLRVVNGDGTKSSDYVRINLRGKPTWCHVLVVTSNV